MPRVVVIGAGLAGLCVAARLAAQGHQVTVCEQAPQIGGKLGLLEHEGFRFDTGPSLLTMPQVYRDLFADTGAPLASVLDLVPLDPVCHYRFADGVRFEAPDADPVALAQSWQDTIGGSSGADWLRLHHRAEQIWSLTNEPILHAPVEGLRTMAGLARRPRDVLTVAPWQSLRGLGRQYLTDPRQRMFLDRYATYTGSDPRRAPAALATVAYAEHTFGAWYVPGGLRLLGEAVAERARERGAVVRTACDVQRVLVENDRAVGVQLADGERLTADVVVSAADAHHLYHDLLPGPPGSRGRAALRRAPSSLSGFVILLALRGRTPGLRHHTVLFPKDYDREFDDLFAARPRPCTDPTIYISAPDDPALRPDDQHEAWFVLVNAPPQAQQRIAGVDWQAPGLREQYTQHVLSLMAQRGMDVRQRIRWSHTLSPWELGTRTRTPGGAIYGTSSNGAAAAFLRPRNRSHLRGLFLVGGSSHPGGGLPLVALSAQIVAGLIGSSRR